MNIENFKLREFLKQPPELINEYVVFLGYIDTFETRKPIRKLKVKKVEFVKKNIYSNKDIDVVNVISKVEKIPVEEVFEMRIIKFFGLVNSIKEQINQIARAEEVAFEEKHPSMKWETVGGSERMGKFGIYNQLDKLTNKKPWRYKFFMNMQYAEFFLILAKRKEEADLDFEMSKLKNS